MRNSKTQPKSEIRRGKKRSFAGMRSGTFGAPKGEEKSPVRRQKTWRNLAWTNAKRQPLGNGCETAKHHLNPSSGEAKNGHSQGCEVAPLEPLKEKKRAPVRRQVAKRDATQTKNVTQPSLGQKQNGSLLAMDAKQQNTTYIRAQARQKMVIRRGAKWHLWNP